MSGTFDYKWQATQPASWPDRPSQPAAPDQPFRYRRHSLAPEANGDRVRLAREYEWHRVRHPLTPILQQRDIEIMRLASRGWSNDRISARLGITAGHVSRIIQRQLKLTRKD